MSEFRSDPLFSKPCLIVAEKAIKPHRVRLAQLSDLVAPDSGEQARSCPFCPGNEGLTPREIYRVADSGGRWQTRVFPSHYPAMKLEATDRINDLTELEAAPTFLTSKTAFGVHEVIVESQSHHLSFWELDQERAVKVLQTLQTRVRDLYKDRRLLYIQLFKNHRMGSGAVQNHPHFELLGMPFIPEPILSLNVAKDCLVCELLHAEDNKADQRQRGEQRADQKTAQSPRYLTSTAQFIALMDYAPQYDYQFSIYPKSHLAAFHEAKAEVLSDAASLLSEILTRMNRLLGDLAFNMVIFSAPNSPGFEKMHWFIRVYPRIVRKTGFEISTGIPMIRVSPEDAAALFREKE